MADLSEADRIPPAALALGLAGLVPFALTAAAQWLPVPSLAAPAAMTAGIAYGAVTLSFLGGIRWGTAVGPYGAARQARDFALSALPPLAGWAALLIAHLPGLCLLAAGFFLQALWDTLTVERGRLPAWFGRLRLLFTAGAVPAILAMLLKLVLPAA